MATQIVISNNDSTTIDDSFRIPWVDKGNAMPALENTIHYVLWTSGQKEIQNKIADSDPPEMTGNTDLNDTSDAVGSTTIDDLLTWGETRQIQIEQAQLSHDEAKAVHEAADDGTAWTKTWIDYDPNYS
jgi:hypothetical protein